MPLKNYQYNKILREYDRRRLDCRHILEERKKAVYAEIPELNAIDNDIIEGSVKSGRAALLGDETLLSSLKERNRLLSGKKAQLLKEHGYPSDYLMPFYICPDCKDTGYISDNEKCHCFRQAIVDLIYEQSNVKTAIETENFDTFTYDYYSDEPIDGDSGNTPLQCMKRNMQSVRSFIDNFDDNFDNILLYGNTGVGKTFLSNCIAAELLKSGHTVIYLTAFQLFDILENCKFHKDEDNIEESNNKFSYILDCDLLIIDDLGTEVNNTFVSSQFYLCINERFLRRHATIISTNLSLKQIHDNYSERTYSRILSNYKLLKMTGEDIRIKKLLTS